MKSRTRIISTLLLSSASIIASSAAFAQQVAGSVEQVVVTAEKQSELIQNTPLTVTAISGDVLEQKEINSLSDLAGNVPSLIVSNYGAPGTNTISIRGLGDGYLSDFSGPLVSTYIDDTPVGSSSVGGRGNLFNLDLQPYDIDHVEVLEGPQGTLYGANTMGGLIKYALKRPDLDNFEARAGVDGAHVGDSGGIDWSLRGAVSVPIIAGELAVRVSAFHTSTAGWITNLGTHQNDANSSTENGGRLAVLWTPNDKFSLQLNVVLQDANTNDTSNIVLNGTTLKPLYGPTTTSTAFPQSLTQSTRVYSATGDYKLGFATLTSMVSWSNLNTHLNEDFSIPYASFTGVPGALALYEVPDKVSRFTEETRLASSGDAPLQWMIGQYLDSEHSLETDSWPTFNANYTPLPLSDNLFIDNVQTNYRELAGFLNATYKITDNIDISGGGRYTTYNFSEAIADNGLFFGNVPTFSSVKPGPKSTTVWMTNVRYHIDDNNMFYVRVATGYRPGVANVLIHPVAGVPLETNPDRTENFEAGFKGSLWDGRLTYAADGFHIDWKDLQLEATTATNPPVTYTANGGKAVSDGGEVSGTFRVLDGLNLSGALTYINAHLAEDANALGGVKGDTLPLSAKWAGSMYLDYTRPIDEQLSLLAGLGYRHRDGVISQFAGAGPPTPLPAQDLVDLYVGVAHGDLIARIYGKNIFDNRSYMGLQFLNTPNPRAVPVQPATVGISVDYKM